MTTRAEAIDALSTLRRYATEKAESGQPVSWVSEGFVVSASPRPDKHEGAWLVHYYQCETYYELKIVLQQILEADGFTL